MPGSCKYQLTGKIYYVLDKAPTPGRPYGSINVGVQIDAQYVGTMCIESHGVFLSVNYNPDDVGKKKFTALKESLQKGARVFVAGDLKSKGTGGDLKLYINAKWKDVKVLDHLAEPRNKLYFDGEVVEVSNSEIKVKYSYVNPKEKDPTKKWKECEYSFALNPDCIVQVNPRDNVFIEGRMFCKHPTTNEKLTWLLADIVI